MALAPFGTVMIPSQIPQRVPWGDFHHLHLGRKEHVILQALSQARVQAKVLYHDQEGPDQPLSSLRMTAPFIQAGFRVIHSTS